MNLQSIILLAIVLGLFFVVGYRYIHRQRKSRGGSCCNCSSGSCCS